MDTNSKLKFPVLDPGLPPSTVVTFNGQPYKPGQGPTKGSPCEILSFIYTAFKQVKEQNPNTDWGAYPGAEEWEMLCAQQLDESDKEFAKMLDEIHFDITDSNQPGNAPSNNESPESLGAPPSPQLAVSEGEPVVLSEIGEGDNIGDDSQDKNLPSVGIPHPDFSKGSQEPPSTSADPVITFTGQFTLTVTDVQIPSRGFPLQLTRTYRSGSVYYGPWGFNWDHNYNVSLRELNDGGAAIWTGSLFEEVYKPAPNGEFESPTGIFYQLERQSSTPLTSDRYVLTDREGGKQIFERPDGWPYPDRIPLTRIEDRHGNAHKLIYDPEGKLARVEDHAGRYIKFTYGGCDLLEQVSDHTGRQWRYFHDNDIEHLVAVTKPSTAEFPEGLTTRYEYDRFRQHPALMHNITRVVDSAGNVVVENFYGDEPGTDDFGRVVYQLYGDFEARYRATWLQYVPRLPEAINVPALRVEVVENGVYKVYTFNYRGNLLDERFRLVKDKSYRLVVHTYRYDEVGNLIETRLPNGLGTVIEYDSANPDPRARGNVKRVSLSPPPLSPVVSRTIARYEYESKYNRVKKFRDESGAETTYFYDYEISTVDQGNIVKVDYPKASLPDGSTQQITEHFTWNEFGQLAEHKSGEGHRHAYEYFQSGISHGFLKKALAGVGVENEHVEHNYDLYGNLIKMADAAGAATEYEYNAAGQLIHVLQPEVNGLRGRLTNHYGKDGLLKSQDAPRGSYTDSVINEPFIRTEFTHDVLGHLTAVAHGANTATPKKSFYKRTADDLPVEVTDPLGRIVRVKYDERGLPLHVTYFVGTTEERSFHYSYDRNGNLTKEVDPAGRVTEYRYDVWDRLSETIAPGLPGEQTVSSLEYNVRDEVKTVKVVGIPAPGQAPIILFELHYHFDELGRLFKEENNSLGTTYWYNLDSRLVGSTDQRGNSLQFAHDALGRVKSVTDPVGNQVSYQFDNKGNLTFINELDVWPNSPSPVSNQLSFLYDARNRLIKASDPLGNAYTTEYDDRNLLVAKANPLESRVELNYNIDGEIIHATAFLVNQATSVEHQFRRDVIGRVTEYVDPDSRKTEYSYNLNNDLIKLRHADGDSSHWKYSNGSDLLHQTKPSGTQIEYIYGVNGAVERIHFIPSTEVATTEDIKFAYDGLGRPVFIAQGISALIRTYDTLGRVTAETVEGQTVSLSYNDLLGTIDQQYPDGRIDRITLDSLSRISSIILQSIGEKKLTGEELVVGDWLVQYEYIGSTQIWKRKFANGTETRFSYDTGRRLSAIEHYSKDGKVLASVSHIYDANSQRRLSVVSPPLQGPLLFDYDSLSRLIRSRELDSVPPTSGISSQPEANLYLSSIDTATPIKDDAFFVTSVDTRSERIIKSSGGLTQEIYKHNSLHQLVKSTKFVLGEALETLYTYDKDGNRKADSQYIYVYNALNQLVEARSFGNNDLAIQQKFDPLGRVIERISQNGSAERFVYWDDRRIQHNSLTGQAKLQRLFGMDYDEILLESNGSNYWTHQDTLLSRVLTTDSIGQVAERYSYDPFGIPTIWQASGSSTISASNLGLDPVFGGHFYLPIDLYDARSRLYDPSQGVFLQPDKQGFIDSPCPYVYVGHNPINHVDRSGEWIETAWDIFSLGVGIYSFQDNYRRGNVGGAVLDGIGIVVDALAVALPFIPGGVGAAIKVFRSGNTLHKSFQTGKTIDRAIRSGQAVNSGINVVQGGYDTYDNTRQGHYGSAMLSASGAFLGARGVATRGSVLFGKTTMGGDELVTRFRGDNRIRTYADIPSSLGNPNSAPTTFLGRVNDLGQRWNQARFGRPRDSRLFESVSRSPFVAQSFGNTTRFKVRRADLLLSPYPRYHVHPHLLGKANLYEAEQFVRGGTKVYEPEIVTKLKIADYSEIPITWLERASVYSAVGGAVSKPVESIIDSAVSKPIEKRQQ